MDKYNDQRLSPRVGMVRGMFCALYPFALLCLHYIRFRAIISGSQEGIWGLWNEKAAFSRVPTLVNR